MTRSVKANVVANLLRAVISALLVFILYRYLTKKIGIELLGVWAIVMAATSVTRFGDFGLGASATRFVAKYIIEEKIREASQVIETSVLSTLAFLVFLLPIIYVVLTRILGLVFSGQNYEYAINLLPYALVSMLITTAGSISLSGLDGCQRMDLSAIVAIIGQFIILLLALGLVPEYGLIGLAWAQILQGIFVFASSWILLRLNLPDLSCIPYQWSRKIFKEIIGYGLNNQAGSISMMLLDPATKLLMAKFAGASAAGYLEIATQIIVRVRSLIVSANQAIIPKIAQIKTSKTNKELRLYYIKNIILIVFISMTTFTLCSISGGLISILMLGYRSDEFLFIYQILLIGWATNTITVPAYFFNMGIGEINTNTISHIFIGVLNILLGYILGANFGLYGVIIGYSISLVIGSYILIYLFHSKHKIDSRKMIKKRNIKFISNYLIIIPALIICLSYFSKSNLYSEIIIFLIGLTLLILSIYFDPNSKRLIQKINKNSQPN